MTCSGLRVAPHKRRLLLLQEGADAAIGSHGRQRLHLALDKLQFERLAVGGDSKGWLPLHGGPAEGSRLLRVRLGVVPLLRASHSLLLLSNVIIKK